MDQEDRALAYGLHTVRAEKPASAEPIDADRIRIDQMIFLEWRLGSESNSSASRNIVARRSRDVDSTGCERVDVKMVEFTRKYP